MNPLWSIGLSAIGAAIFVLLARKRWEGWALGIANQAAWGIYATVTHQWGFYIGCVMYGGSYVYGLVKWRREAKPRPTREFAAVGVRPALQGDEHKTCMARYCTCGCNGCKRGKLDYFRVDL